MPALHPSAHRGSPALPQALQMPATPTLSGLQVFPSQTSSPTSPQGVHKPRMLRLPALQVPPLHANSPASPHARQVPRRLTGGGAADGPGVASRVIEPAASVAPKPVERQAQIQAIGVASPYGLGGEAVAEEPVRMHSVLVQGGSFGPPHWAEASTGAIITRAKANAKSVSAWRRPVGIRSRRSTIDGRNMSCLPCPRHARRCEWMEALCAESSPLAKGAEGFEGGGLTV